MVTESELSQSILDAVDGDDDAFMVVWRHYQPLLLSYLRTVADANDVSDVASAIWIDVVRRLHGFSGGEPEFRAWLFTLARRRCIDNYRYRARHPAKPWPEFDEFNEVDVLIDRAGPESEAMAHASTESALALISTLPPSEAEVVALRVIGDLDVDAVAEIVGKRPGTVRVLCHRGLNRLREVLVKKHDVPADGVMSS